MTESEAKTKWCPFSRMGGRATDEAMSGSGWNRFPTGMEMYGAPHGCACIGSACMAWQWFNPNADSGYCTALSAA